MNEIKLSGWVYSKKQVNDKLATFAIKYYAGKDKTGNPVNGFMNCKYFGIMSLNDSDKIEVSGWLGYDTWEKDGKKQGRTVICCKEYQGAVNNSQQNSYSDMNDEIPF
jgi:hypothetical protein